MFALLPIELKHTVSKAAVPAANVLLINEEKAEVLGSARK
jgi:hypothetical protein